jgi:uncharacterized membrane protein YjfL (UPF0719 family)
LGYFVFDKLARDCDFAQELTKGNKAVAIVVAGLFLALSILVASVIKGIVG